MSVVMTIWPSSAILRAEPLTDMARLIQPQMAEVTFHADVNGKTRYCCKNHCPRITLASEKPVATAKLG